jgi:aldehyde dehydrogenase (NAD+)
VVLKPCNVAPHTALVVSKLVKQFMDPSWVSVVGPGIEGDRHTITELLEQKLDLVFYTGSPSVGRVVMQAAAKHLTPVVLELGGKNPTIVAADADLSVAARRILWGGMMNAGQQCIRPDYVLVERSVEEELLRHLKRWAKTMYGSEDGGGEAKGGVRPRDQVGRIINARHMQRLTKLIDQVKGGGGRSSGDEIIVGGQYEAESRYIAPTVLRVGRDSPTMEEETFGPIVLVCAVDSIEEAVQHVNARPKPLALYIFSSSEATQELIINSTSAGGVTVNATLFHAGHTELPFGGVGDSGMGSYHGRASFDTFSHKKPVVRKAVWPDGGVASNPELLYPPWSKFKTKALRTAYSFT